jgi:peptide/nickel transport system permease protein
MGHRLRASPTLVAGAVLVGAVCLVALLSFVWTPADPAHVSIPDRFLGPGQRGHLLGTDQLGRDELSLLLAGARNTLLVGIVAVGIAIVVGVPSGGLAAIYRGPVEEATMRASDLLLAFPALLLALLFAAVFRPGTVTVMAAIGIAFVPVFARLVRGVGLQVAEQDYVTVARTFGTGRVGLLWRHVLPNTASAIIVQAAVAFGIAVLAEAALSYLGLGTPPPTPSWGRMLSESQAYLAQAPMLALWPGLGIAVTVLGFNLLGDGLRDRLDPRLVESVARQ